MPRPLDAWVGRQAQLLELETFVADPARRLMTVWGPGGVGKTRLALEVVGRAGMPARFVSLAGIVDAPGLQARVAQGLGLLLTHADEAELAWGVAQQGPLLLILDNAEDCVDALRHLAGLLLSAARSLKVLVTSRESLRVGGETALELLALSPREALELLRVRASASGVALEDGAANALCAALEHLPLALELAAARLRVMPAQALLDALAGGDPGVLRDRARPPGRQSLGEVLETSVRALLPSERRALDCCALLDGPVDAGVLAAVLVDAAGVDAPWDVLQTLRDRSLLQHAPGGGHRFTMLQSVRGLLAPGVDAALLPRVAHSVARVAQAHTQGLQGPERVASLAFLSGHVALLETLALGARGDDAAALALAVHGVRVNQGPYAMHQALLDHALEQAATPVLVINTLVALGRVHFTLGQMETAAPLLRRAWDLSRRHAVHAGEVDAALQLALMEHALGRGNEALELLGEAKRVADNAADPLRQGQVEAIAGLVHHVLGNLDAAAAAYHAGVTALLAAGETVLRGRTLSRLGFLAQDLGRLEEAAAFHGRARVLLQQAQHPGLEAIVVGYLGNLYRQQRRWRDAEEHYLSAVGTLQRMGDVDFAATFWMDLGIMRLLQQRFGDAVDALTCALPLATASRQVMLTALVEVYLGTALAARGDAGGARLHARVAGQLQGRQSAAARILEMHQAVSGLWQPKPSVAAVQAAREAVARGKKGPGNEHVRLTISMLEARLEAVAPSRGVVRVWPDARAFAVGPGAVVDLSRRKPLQRLLAALRDAHHVGQPAQTATLLNAGWPGENLVKAAALNRLRVAITTLRTLGLRDVLTSVPGGYALSPEVAVVLVASGETPRQHGVAPARAENRPVEGR